MTDPVKKNRHLAKRIGWEPSDFGVQTFDAALVEAIREYQAEHFLPVTGLADEQTVIAMFSIAKAQPDIVYSEERLELISQLGLMRGEPRTYAAKRSVVFAGTTWFLHPEDLDHDLDQYLTQCDNIAIPPDLFGEYEPPPHLRQLPWIRSGLAEPWKAGRLIGEWLSDLDVPGAIVEIDGDEILEWGSRSVTAWHNARMAKTEIPMAIVSSVSRHIRKMKKGTFAHFKALCCFDAGFPVIPGLYFARQAMEYMLGETTSEWRKICGIYMNRVFPAFEPKSETVPNHIHRFRSWLKNRSIRGCGWRGGIADEETMQAFWGPLPPTIRRIDYL